ncbi:multidrug DMT transporter permease [Humitalea sp. 24SJ18S-53]|uniref:multidrug DMT transporter permease n=1 Tax=Humitalea sp. 24SJ18S-53 TaxID=3422307 RepID=UPI003D678C31
MDPYFLAVTLLSVGSFVHTRSDVPELRPTDEQVDNAWRWLSRAALFSWIGMLVWGVISLPFWMPTAAFVASLTFNAFVALRGPQTAWPALSVMASVFGLGLAGWTLWG